MPDGRGGKRPEGKNKGATKRSGGKKSAADKKGAAKAEEKVDYGPPLQRRGLFATGRADNCPLRTLMYGHGDVQPENICSGTVDLLEDVVIDYCSALLEKASDQASLRNSKCQAEDILFVLRKDQRKFDRSKKLMAMNEEIKQARKQFEEDEAILRRLRSRVRYRQNPAPWT